MEVAQSPMLQALVQLTMKRASGLTQLAAEFEDDTKRLAVCVAGWMAEHAFAKPSGATRTQGDLRQMLQLLKSAEARAARNARGSLQACGGDVQRQHRRCEPNR